MIKINRKVLYIAYFVVAQVIGSFGVDLCTKANFGISTLSSTPYVFHIFLRDRFPFFTQGTCEYTWQLVIFILTCIICKKYKHRYWLSFLSAFINGVLMDLWYILLKGNAAFLLMHTRIISFIIGTLLISLSVACYFRTTLPLKVYEFTVREISDTYKIDRILYKRLYDAGIFIFTLVLAYVLNRKFDGVGIGTIIVTVVNGPLIGYFGNILDKIFVTE